MNGRTKKNITYCTNKMASCTVKIYEVLKKITELTVWNVLKFPWLKKVQKKILVYFMHSSSCSYLVLFSLIFCLLSTEIFWACRRIFCSTIINGIAVIYLCINRWYRHSVVEPVEAEVFGWSRSRFKI